MIINENEIVNEDNKTIVNDDVNQAIDNNDSMASNESNDSEVQDIPTSDNKDNNIVAVHENNPKDVILNYLDPAILKVKEYTYEELNANIEFDSQDSLDSIDKDIYEVKMEDVSEKQLVKGKVVAIYDKEVIVDIGFKSEGIIDKTEFDSIPEIGAEIDVFLVVFEDRKGRLILSKRRADFEKRWSELRDAAENETLLKGTIVKIIKGGLVVDLGVVNAFLPGSQVDIKPSPNFEEYLNKEYEFKIVKFNEFRQNVVVSRKATMDSDIDENRAKPIIFNQFINMVFV